jgi:hypothetical protein
MKTYLLFAALTVIILSGCSTSKSTADYDDVYSTTKKKSGTTSSVNDKTQVASPDYYQEGSEKVSGIDPENYETGDNVAYNGEPYLNSTETMTTPEGTSITNNYYEGYGNDDYYDYSYADRINRFYGPYMGYNYYAPCYTGYYYDPWYWDSYWYRPSLYFGMSWGWGSMYWGYPYYYSYYPYNDYWYGYNQGYWNGYYDGYYGYNYYDYYGSNYYGHRSGRSGSNSPTANTYRESYQNEQLSNQAKIFERTTPQLAADNFNSGRNSINSRGTAPGRSSSNSAKNQNELIANPQNNQPSAERNSDQIIGNNQQDPIGRNSTNTNGGTGNIAMEKNNSQVVTQDKPRESGTTSRYTYKKPALNNNEVKSGYKPGQSIESNSSSRPSQKYSKPSDRSVTSGSKSSGQQGTTTGTQNRQVYSRPQTNNNNSYSKPSGYNSESQRSSQQPSRSSSNSFSQPSRSSTNSQPSNSSRNYSQPARSSGNSGTYSSPSRSSSSSYSAPSRSSSSSGSSPSRSSGGGSSSGGSRGGRK